MEKTQVMVRVGGQDFRLCGTESEEYIQSVCTYVDAKVLEMQKLHPALSTSACVMLTAVNLADELFKLRQQYAELDQRIEELRNLPRTTAAETSKPAPRPKAPKAPVKRPFESKEPVPVR